MHNCGASSSPSTCADSRVDMAQPGENQHKTYDSPLLIELGNVRALTLGSSSSGKADANSQYYW